MSGGKIGETMPAEPSNDDFIDGRPRAKEGRELSRNLLKAARGRTQPMQPTRAAGDSKPSMSGRVSDSIVRKSDRFWRFGRAIRVLKEIGLIPDVKMTEEQLAAEDQVILELLITQNSRLIEKTPAQADFRRRYGAFVLAIRRLGATIYTKIAQTRLHLSDTLLVMAPQERLAELRDPRISWSSRKWICNSEKSASGGSVCL